MGATLYGIPLSHPVIAARLALEHKGVPFRDRTLLPGAHPLLLAALGFRPTTVPALRLVDGTRVQGSLAIVQALEAAVPTPSLYPADPAARARVEAAERWGEQVLQPVPRRLMRRALVVSRDQRRWFAQTAMPLPAPRVVATALAPVSRVFAALVHADLATTDADLAALDRHLDHVDALLAEGTIGSGTVNAADCQIAPSVRVLLAFADLHDRVAAHGTATAFAERLVPEYPEIPGGLTAG